MSSLASKKRFPPTVRQSNEITLHRNPRFPWIDSHSSHINGEQPHFKVPYDIPVKRLITDFITLHSSSNSKNWCTNRRTEPMTDAIHEGSVPTSLEFRRPIQLQALAKCLLEILVKSKIFYSDRGIAAWSCRSGGCRKISHMYQFLLTAPNIPKQSMTD